MVRWGPGMTVIPNGIGGIGRGRASRALPPPTEPGCSRVRQYGLVDIGNIRCRLRGRVGSEHLANCRGGVMLIHPHPARVLRRSIADASHRRCSNGGRKAAYASPLQGEVGACHPLHIALRGIRAAAPYAPAAARGRAPAAGGSNQEISCATALMAAIPRAPTNRWTGIEPAV